MTASELNPQTMLQHLFMSCRKMQLHLTAYSAATATREMVSDDDVPDEDCYEYEKDRAMTDEMLLISKELVERIEQHRATYYPGLPAFEQLTVNTTPDWEGGTPRLHNNNEMIHWNLIGYHIGMSYAETLTADTPAGADAQKLVEMVDMLVELNREHGEECVRYGDIDGATCYIAVKGMDEINPIYTDLLNERESRN